MRCPMQCSGNGRATLQQSLLEMARTAFLGKELSAKYSKVLLALPLKDAEPGGSVAAIRLAVKRMNTVVMRLDHAEDSRASFITSFRREIHVLSRLRHPNIVKLIGFSEPFLERQEPPCLVYEFLALGSLSSQLKDDVRAALLPWQTRIDILLQISTAINYLHCHNPGFPAYHRDIKADNIALSADYTSKLID